MNYLSVASADLPGPSDWSAVGILATFCMAVLWMLREFLRSTKTGASVAWKSMESTSSWLANTLTSVAQTLYINVVLPTSTDWRSMVQTVERTSIENAETNRRHAKAAEQQAQANEILATTLSRVDSRQERIENLLEEYLADETSRSQKTQNTAQAKSFGEHSHSVFSDPPMA